MAEIETTLKGVFKIYHQIPKQRRGLTDIPNVLEEDVPYFSGMKQVR